MTFDVFRLRDTVVGEYREYFKSFVHIDDEQIRGYVEERLREGEPWPDAVLQLNPVYEAGATLGELADAGTITTETARFFGRDLRLHRHQEEALGAARGGKPYIVSTGTGSGKSLTYLLPILDHVFRQGVRRESVQAIIVYPMNALINSQMEALRVLHFDPASGEQDPEWEGKCGVACYDCLLSYSNQGAHRRLDRWLVRDFLLALGRSAIGPEGGNGWSYEEQFEHLLPLADPESPLERDFLVYLRDRQLRLPDAAQTQPHPDVAVQPDFYYERDGLPGVCVFVDGAMHDGATQAAHDRAAREALEDRGFRVIAVRGDAFAEEAERYPEVFGPT